MNKEELKTMNNDALWDLISDKIEQIKKLGTSEKEIAILKEIISEISDIKDLLKARG